MFDSGIQFSSEILYFNPSKYARYCVKNIGDLQRGNISPQPFNSAMILKQLGDSENTLNHLFRFDGDPILKKSPIDEICCDPKNPEN